VPPALRWPCCNTRSGARYGVSARGASVRLLQKGEREGAAAGGGVGGHEYARISGSRLEPSDRARLPQARFR
jgi:hypothetical protein